MTYLKKIIYINVLSVAAIFTGHAQNVITLKQALNTARDNNPVLKTQTYDIDLAKGDVVTAHLIPNVVLNNQSLFLANSNIQVPNNSTFLGGRYNQIWFQATKKFQIAGLRKNKIDVAQKQLTLTEKGIEDIKRNLYQTVASKWVDVWTAKKKLDIISLAKNNIDSVLIINQNRLKNQVITQIDYNRTELLANQYELQIKNAQQDFKNEIAHLKFLMGISNEITIDDKDPFQYLNVEGFDAILQDALQNRSDIIASKSAIEMTKSNIKLQHSLVYPQPELGLIYNPQNGIPYLGGYATVELPFFSRNQGEIQKAKVMKMQSEQDLMTKQQQIQTELIASYESYMLQKKNIDRFSGLLKQSDTILSSVKYAYLRGGTTIIDFLEAQRSWLDTQQQYYDALQQYRQNYVDLLYQSGMLNNIAN